jgi:hypothetical protein
MDKKKTILIGIISATVIISIIMLLIEKPAYPVLILGALSFFIIFGAYEPPSKHKNFGYRDQQRAMRAFDRTDSLEFEIGSKPKKKKKKKALK